MNLPKFDNDQNTLFENIPILFMVGIMVLMWLPVIPAAIKGPLSIGSTIIIIPLTIFVEKAAQYAASTNIVLKSVIFGWDIEKEFHCKKPVGPLTSRYNQATGTYITPWELVTPVKLPIYGQTPVNIIEIEHKGAWNQRASPKQHWVRFKGIRVKHANTYFVILHPQRRPTRINTSLKIIPRFTLSEGNEDIFNLKGRFRDDILGVVPQ